MCVLPRARLLSRPAASPPSSVGARLHRYAKHCGQAFRSRPEPSRGPATAGRGRQRKNPAALARALSSDAPCRERLPSAAACFSAHESRTRRRARSCTAQKSQRIRGAWLVLVHDGDMLPASLLQQLIHAVFRKPWVASFDCKEKSVIGHTAETFPVEHRMVPARQAIHALPSKKCGERCEKHCKFEHDREERWNGKETLWFPVHIERVEKR